MADLDGAYECVTQTPMGDQASIFTILSDGDSFTGRNEGDLGSLDILDGRIEGNTILWKMKLTKPMPITLNARATISEDGVLDGSLSAGAFGNFSMKGRKRV